MYPPATCKSTPVKIVKSVIMCNTSIACISNCRLYAYTGVELFVCKYIPLVIVFVDFLCLFS